MHWLKQIYDWLELRLQLEGPIKEAAAAPRSAQHRQLVVCLRQRSLHAAHAANCHRHPARHRLCALRGQAWNSLHVLNHQLPLGWFLRAMHGWGSNFMVAVVLIHMAQVFLFGAYKFPRELTWILGVFLLLMTLGMAFTGQVLRFDQDAYWGLGIGASIVSRVPLIGGPLVHLHAGRTDHCWCHPVALLCPACLRHSRNDARLRCRCMSGWCSSLASTTGRCRAGSCAAALTSRSTTS